MSQTSKKGRNDLDKKLLFHENNVIVVVVLWVLDSGSSRRIVAIICRDILFSWIT